ncbi:endolytic transglycosylase MltG [Candidatus Uhrbacteria bacterium]|nr:endolytic transglycosylase MltG [Candidatus Uhrbacteria bacterium]
MMRIFALIIAILVLVGVSLGGSFLWDSFLLSPAKDATEVVIEVAPGASVDTITRTLKEKEIITSRFFFKTYVKLAHAESSLQAGRFTLKPKTSFHSVVSTLSNAKANEVQVTIPEGFTRDQIGATLSAAFSGVDTTSWKQVTNAPTTLTQGQELLAGIPSGQGLEGYLFPDTYRFRNDADAKTVAETMVLTLQRRLAENAIVVPTHLVMPNGLTFHQVLTLASLVEKEVRAPEDMAHVAGIFYTRLKIGMALQADATVNYVTGKSDPAISLKDQQVDSPYNTYQHLGLPPGPISNPGMNAIKAVLNPVDSDDLYYLTTPDGQVIYAKTFNEHVANKYRYMRGGG